MESKLTGNEFDKLVSDIDEFKNMVFTYCQQYIDYEKHKRRTRHFIIEIPKDEPYIFNYHL